MIRQESTDSGCLQLDHDENDFHKINKENRTAQYNNSSKKEPDTGPNSLLGEITQDDILEDKKLRTWIKNMSSGLITDSDYKCCLAQFPIPGLNFKVRGIQATETLNPGDIICKIPIMSCTVGGYRVMLDEDIQRFLFEFPSDFKYEYTEIFALYLILHKLKGRQSKIYEYIQTLPEEYSTPNTWEMDKLVMLFPRERNYVMEEVEDMKKIHKALAEDLQKIGLVEDLTFELYQWAYNSIKTRTFACTNNDEWNRLSEFLPELHPRVAMDKEKSYYHLMCPMIDMVNHSTIYENANVRMNPDMQWELFCTKKINPGEQIYIEYNPDPSHAILYNYGFVDLSCLPNKYEKVFFEMQDFVGTDAEKISFLKATKNTNLYFHATVGCSRSLQKAAIVAVADSVSQLKKNFFKSSCERGQALLFTKLKQKANRKIKAVFRSKLQNVLNSVLKMSCLLLLLMFLHFLYVTCNGGRLISIINIHWREIYSKPKLHS